MDITLVRGSGTHPAEDIYDPLLSTEAVAVARGETVLDDAEVAEETTIECPLLPQARNGLLVGGFDTETSRRWRGKVVSVRHRCVVGDDGVVVQTTELRVRRRYADH